MEFIAQVPLSSAPVTAQQAFQGALFSEKLKIKNDWFYNSSGLAIFENIIGKTVYLRNCMKQGLDWTWS